jgi:hypothetical protein
MGGWVFLTFVVAGVVIYLLVKADKGQKQQKAEEAARRKRNREEQQEYREQMIVLGEQSLDLFESLP